MLDWRFGNLHVTLYLPFVASLLALMLIEGGVIPLWCLIASLMHETGHIVAVLLLQSRPVEVELGVYGMRLLSANSTMSYRRQTMMLLAGPAVNLFTAGLLTLCGSFSVAAGVHLVLGLFNLLPIEPLDGGQALLCGLSRRTSVTAAERWVFGISLSGCFLLLLGGGWMLLAGGYNYTLLAVAIYLLVLMFWKHKQ